MTFTSFHFSLHPQCIYLQRCFLLSGAVQTDIDHIANKNATHIVLHSFECMWTSARLITFRLDLTKTRNHWHGMWCSVLSWIYSKSHNAQEQCHLHFKRQKTQKVNFPEDTAVTSIFFSLLTSRSKPLKWKNCFLNSIIIISMPPTLHVCKKKIVY